MDFNSFDDWDGEIDYWDLIFRLKYRDYTAIADKKDKIEGDILTVLEQFHVDGRNQLANVLIQPLIELYIDWKAIILTRNDEKTYLIATQRCALISIL